MISVKQATGDIWALHAQGYYVVIPTNMYVTAEGQAVMGRGLALQASEKWPKAPLWYAFHLIEHVRRTPYGKIVKPDDINPRDLLAVNHEWRAVFLPVKFHWQEQASVPLIKAALENLRLCMQKPILESAKLAIPRLGCGNGALEWEKDVKPTMRQFLELLSDEERARIVIVHPSEEFLRG